MKLKNIVLNTVLIAKWILRLIYYSITGLFNEEAKTEQTIMIWVAYHSLLYCYYITEERLGLT